MWAIFADFVFNNHEVNMILYNSSVNKLILCYIFNTILQRINYLYRIAARLRATQQCLVSELIEQIV